MSLSIPRHIAIIPDGNRRWATAHGVPFQKGYERGTATTHTIIEDAFKRGVTYLTVWASSEDNLLKRTKGETMFLRKLFVREFEKMFNSKVLMEQGIRVRVIGTFREILNDPKLNAVVAKLEEKTKSGVKGNLTVLLGYDGRKEMADAVTRLVRKGDNGRIGEDAIQEALWTGMLPPVDLVIRTGGEPHWSAGFLMWLTANSEFHFTHTYWPAFDTRALGRAIRDFGTRRRMLGK